MLGPSLRPTQDQAMLAPLIDKVAFVEAINDAWALVALMTLAALRGGAARPDAALADDRDDPQGPRRRPPATPLIKGSARAHGAGGGRRHGNLKSNGALHAHSPPKRPSNPIVPPLP